MALSPIPKPLTHKKHGPERNDLMGRANAYLDEIDEVVQVSDEQRSFVPGFNFEDDLAEIDRAVEAGLISPQEAMEVIDALDNAHSAAEAEEIMVKEALDHPHAA